MHGQQNIKIRKAKYTSFCSMMFTTLFTKIRPMVKNIWSLTIAFQGPYCTCKPTNQCN